MFVLLCLIILQLPNFFIIVLLHIQFSILLSFILSRFSVAPYSYFSAFSCIHCIFLLRLFLYHFISTTVCKLMIYTSLKNVVLLQGYNLYHQLNRIYLQITQYHYMYSAQTLNNVLPTPLSQSLFHIIIHSTFTQYVINTILLQLVLLQSNLR